MIEVGSVVNGKYRLTRLLGEGGMGTVYEAEHGGLGTRVAIKVLHPDLARRSGLVERFLQEARVAAQIRSLHVVQVTDVDRTSEGQAYIVMELLNGEPLSVVLGRQTRLPPPIACEYALQVLQALEAAHALGIIHRDLKPENVFVTLTDDRPLLKLIDFGIAKARPTDPHQRSLTVAGVLMGTAEYMAPEQARSADKVDARSDLYAVGVLLYEMLAGARPVTGDDARVVALKVERGEVVPLVQAAPDVPREIAGLVHRAMAARPDLRFSTATEMRVALESLATGARTRASPPMARDGRGSRGSTAAHSTQTTESRPRSGEAGDVPSPPGVREDSIPIATIRAPPIATALAPQAPAGGAVLPGGAWNETPRRQRRARTFATVALSLLFGASTVAIFVAAAMWNSGAPLRPALAVSPTPAQAARAAPPPELVTAPASTSRPPPSAGIPALLPPPRAPLAPAARPSASAPGASSGTDAATSILPLFAFPMALPSSLPPFPSALPLPAGFPTTLPTVLPAWPLPPAAPSASSSGQTL